MFMALVIVISIYLTMDYIYWTERADLGLDAIMRLQAVERPVKRVELWVTGRLTPKAKSEIEAAGVIVKEQIGEKLIPPAMLE